MRLETVTRLLRWLNTTRIVLRWFSRGCALAAVFFTVLLGFSPEWIITSPLSIRAIIFVSAIWPLLFIVESFHLLDEKKTTETPS